MQDIFTLKLKFYNEYAMKRTQNKKRPKPFVPPVNAVPTGHPNIPVDPLLQSWQRHFVIEGFRNIGPEVRSYNNEVWFRRPDGRYQYPNTETTLPLSMFISDSRFTIVSVRCLRNSALTHSEQGNIHLRDGVLVNAITNLPLPL